MSNPYASPAPPPSQGEIDAPAIALIVVSVIAIGCGLLALGVDVLLLVSGAVERLEANNDSPISKYTQITIRCIWGLVLVIASLFVLYGAWHMKQRRNYGLARAAAVVALIPLVGPCCLLGIPFGIWALVVLNKPHVRNAFT